MGGRSNGTWSVSSSYGVMDGNVLDVPSLSAPGFIKAAADGTFPDASGALGGSLVLEVRSSTPSYTGFRVSFAAGTLSAAYACSGGGSLPFSRGCYKTKFSVPAGDEWSTVTIPFTSFSDKWSPATGEQTTTCAADSDVCPTASALSGIKRVEFWAEGVDGKVSSARQSCASRVARVPAHPDCDLRARKREDGLLLSCPCDPRCVGRCTSRSGRSARRPLRHASLRAHRRRT
jgi:hypothetical protein